MASSHFTLQNLILLVFKIEPVTKFVTLCLRQRFSNVSVFIYTPQSQSVTKSPTPPSIPLSPLHHTVTAKARVQILFIC